MPESYVLRGLIIGVVFGVPAGVIGVLSIQRSLSQGALAGFVTGIGSSAADVLYACVGVFGISLISDFLLKNQCLICLAGSLLIIVIGIRSLKKRKKESRMNRTGTSPEDRKSLGGCFISAFFIAIANPTTILSFMVVFSLFQIGESESIGQNIRLVLGIFFGTCVWWAAIAFLVGRFRNRLTTGFNHKMEHIFGALMVVMGVVIGGRMLFSLRV